MNILIFNCGSSSQSFKVYRVSKDHSPVVVASGKAKNVATRTKAHPVVDWQIDAEIGSVETNFSSHRQAAKAIRNLAPRRLAHDQFTDAFKILSPTFADCESALQVYQYGLAGAIGPERV